MEGRGLLLALALAVGVTQLAAAIRLMDESGEKVFDAATATSECDAGVGEEVEVVVAAITSHC